MHRDEICFERKMRFTENRMKYSLLFAFIFGSLSLSAQNHVLGFFGGMSSTLADTKEAPAAAKPRSGVSIGFATYDLFLTKRWYISSGLEYNEKGYQGMKIKYVIPTAEYYVISDYVYNYFSMPLKLGYNYGKKLYGFAGVGVVSSYLWSAAKRSKSFDENGNLLREGSSGNHFALTKFDFSGILEAGLGYKIQGKVWIYSSFAFHRSLNTMTTEKYYPNGSLFHYGYTAVLGIKHVLKQKE